MDTEPFGAEPGSNYEPTSTEPAGGAGALHQDRVLLRHHESESGDGLQLAPRYQGWPFQAGYQVRPQEDAGDADQSAHDVLGLESAIVSPDLLGPVQNAFGPVGGAARISYGETAAINFETNDTLGTSTPTISSLQPAQRLPGREPDSNDGAGAQLPPPVFPILLPPVLPIPLPPNLPPQVLPILGPVNILFTENYGSAPLERTSVLIAPISDGITICVDDSTSNVSFLSIPRMWQIIACNNLNIYLYGNIPIPSGTHRSIPRLAPPDRNYNPRVSLDHGDGFYNTFCYYISGSPIQHLIIRSNIKNFIYNNKQHFSNLFERNSVEQAYFNHPNILTNTTDIEIIAAATLFKANIYVYKRLNNNNNNTCINNSINISSNNYQWVSYLPINNMPSSIYSNNRIPQVNLFIDHSSGNHFEPVLHIKNFL